MFDYSYIKFIGTWWGKNKFINRNKSNLTKYNFCIIQLVLLPMIT